MERTSGPGEVPRAQRTGKRLPVTHTELRLMFKRPPPLAFGLMGPHIKANQLVVTLDPSTGVGLVLDARRADIAAARKVELDMEFCEQGGEGARPYAVRLRAAPVGDSSRFTRQEGVIETWRVMQPLLDTPTAVHAYAPGSWAPAEVDGLTGEYGGWHRPWVAS
jgi:glucose-6-phosphate 1-dehydrogenase